MDFLRFTERFLGAILICMLVVLAFAVVVALPLAMYDGSYVKPIAAEKANQICEDKGFDFYESFSRVGILSKEPVAIKCKYVEQYRNIDVQLNKQED